MKVSTRIVGLMLIALFVSFGPTAFGQSILNPSDPIVAYNPSSPPAIPAYGTIAKWVRTKRMSWNTDQWKCYIYNGKQFRLRFPKTYNPTAVDGKQYPMLIFMHGDGEGGTVYDNEFSLYHGGNIFDAAVTNGTFDGYILVMQTSGSWGNTEYAAQRDIIEYMITNNKLDPFRVTLNGLSAGGEGTWRMYQTYPTYPAGILPMSSVAIVFASPDSVNKFKFTPIWNIHGGLDGSPAPYTAAQVNAAMQAQGANYVDLNMVTQGHDTWDSTWSMPAFWPWLLSKYCSNPWTLFGRTQFCQGDNINLTVGLVQGYQAYQWRKDGVVIPGATGNTINVTAVGTYDARVERNGIWSNWSPTPVVISYAAPTVTPNITVGGLMSKVIPVPDGNQGVTLFEPTGYATYTWQKVGSGNTIGTGNTYYATTPGQYICQVTQQYGCSSNFSAPFTVVSASGANKPDAASGLVASPLSQTSVVLNWSQNPAPTYNETNFEVYQATHTGGPYKLVAITGADISNATITGLAAGTKYYYIVRAVDSTGAAGNSNEASTSTVADTQPPTAPGNLTVSGSSQSSITLSWTASTDNVGVTQYYVYVNGAKSYVVASNQTNFTVGNLNYKQSYAFYVTAADTAGNVSPASNQVSGEPLISGLTYQFFTFATAPTKLPNYSTLTPVATGAVSNVTLSPATQTTNYGFLFQGYLHVTTAGNYTFQTNSDDGSALYLGTLNSTASAYNFAAKPLVNNDGVHGGTTVTSNTVSLSVGTYPIAVAYFQGGGGNSLTVGWKVPGSNNFVAIPASAYNDAPVVNGVAPAAPSNVVATSLSYNKIGLTWADNSNNESNFEIWRSSSPSSGFVTIGTVGAGVTSYTDSTVAASTRYYYEVRADNLYGQSPFAMNYTLAEWKFNNNYADSSGNGYTLTAVGSPTFDATTFVEGTRSLKLSGSSQGATIPNTGGFLQTAYTQGTIAGWIKPSTTTGTNRVIFDIGGSDNGLALLLNNTTLIAAIASGNTRTSISTTLNSTAWNHVAVVYNGDSLLLYVNGTLAASNTSLSFHTINSTTNGSRFGQTNGSNAFNNNGNAFGGWLDDFGIYNTAFGPDVIQALKNFTYAQSNATTKALPAAPAAPNGLTAKALSSSSIGLTWTNNAVNADNVQVFRSANNNQQYVQWAVLPASATSFTDSGLFANAIYYYKVRAVNVGGNSAFATESSATTMDNLPVITDLPSVNQARYGTTTTFNVSATSVNSGALTFTAYNLPAFASFTDNGNRTGVLTVTPQASDAGTYPGLYIVVKDAFGGADTTAFSLVVNNNYAPVLSSIGNYTMNEGDTLTIPLSGSNQNQADTLSFSVAGAPAGSVVTNVSNGSANLFLQPRYSAAGVYTVQVTLNDNNGLSATQNFTLTVVDKSPTSKIFTRFAYNDAGALGLPWNALLGATTNNLLDSTGSVTTVGVNFDPTYWWNTFSGGSSTGNNSGVYPDQVLTDYYWFGSVYGGPDVINGTVSGVDTAQLYDLTFFANSVYNGMQDNGWTTYTSGGQTVQLHVQNNQTNTVTLQNLRPAADGTIPFAMGLGQNTQLGYINAMVITKHFDDGTAPAGISGLTAQNAPSQVQLSWADSAYNATGYEVWRALTADGSYSLQGTVPGNTANAYVDSTVSGNTGYSYKVRAVNGHGNSPFDSVSTVTLNRLPKINAVANIVLKDTQSVTVNVTTVDDATAHLTLTANNLPPFANFVDNGNGTGVLTVTPSAGGVGIFPNVSITVTDVLDSSATTIFSIAVTEPNVQSIYVNFTGGASCPAPWNTLLTPPFAGSVMSNLLDDSGTPTGVSATLVEGFNWFGTTGTANGNLNGSQPSQLVYPPAVVQNFFYDPSTDMRHIQISGLDNSKQYNFVFFNSMWDGTNGLTTFTINNDSVHLQADWNINKTVQLNGITPVNGEVTIGVSKGSGAANSYINSIVIQGYSSAAGTLLSPADLRAVNITQTTVQLQWQDRSAIETGYEVWRASDQSDSYSLIASLPANATAYVDTRLSRGVNYYYIVRAASGGSYSNYSAPLAITTYSDAIYIHPSYTSAGNGPTPPWNNLNSGGGVGTSWSNFIDSTGAITSVGMVQTGEFAGANQLGNVTGNNSGVYPDPVLLQQYVLFPGNFGAFTVSGLNLSKTYDFTFFGTENYEYGDQNTGYIVNGDTVYLNALYNTNATVTLHGVVPDAMGQANIRMFCPGASLAGWFNAMVISGYSPVPRNAPAVPQTTGGGNTTFLTTAVAPQLSIPQAIVADTVVRAYPNPFHTSFTLSVPVFNDNEKVMVALFDLNGRMVYRKEFDNVTPGMNYLQVGQDSRIGAPGIYIGRVIFSSGRAPQVFKLLKN